MPSNFLFIFWAKDFNNSVAFYRDLLECPITREWDRGPGKRGSVFALGTGELEILDGPPDKEKIQPTGFEISINVPDVDEYYRFINEKGIAIRGELAEKPWGARTFSVNDPNGIKLIFSSPV